MLILKELLQGWHYCHAARNDGKNRPIGSWPIKADRDTGYVLRLPDVDLIVVDSTSNLREWLENALWVPVGKSKRAYAFKNVADELLPQIEKICDKEKPKRLTGHSRGAAIVCDLGLELVQRGYTVEYVLPFGGPKNGGRRFINACKRAKLTVYRIGAKGDFVTWLPFFIGAHYSTEKRILKNRIKSGAKTHLSYGRLLKKLIKEKGEDYVL